MPITADELLDELRAHRRAIATLFASSKDDDEDAARKHEEEAKRHEATAASHRTAARKARDDGDDEDATRHEEDARKARMEAAQCRTEARKAHDASGKMLAAGDDDAKKQHETEAKRLKDDEEAAAKRMADDEEDAKRHEEDAAAKRKGGNMAPMLAMFLRAMTQDGDNMDAMKDADNLSLLKHLAAMVYPAGPRQGKRSQSAANNDNAEDTALFKRLIKQYKDDGELHASHGVADVRVERKLRSLEAAVGEMGKLLTDVMHGLRDLATDKGTTGRGLATDNNRQQNGGPTRKTMSATGGDYRGKFDDQDAEDTRQTEQEINAALDAQQLDPVQRMAAKLQLVYNNQVKH